MFLFEIFSKKRSIDEFRQTAERQVLNIGIFGDQKVGKSSLIDFLIGEEFQEDRTTTEMYERRAGKVIFKFGKNNQILKEKTVIFHEFTTKVLYERLREEDKDSLDLSIICYENPNHLNHFLQEYGTFIPAYIPRLAVQCKIDDEELNNFETGAFSFERFGVKLFGKTSAKLNQEADLISSIFHLLNNP